MILKKYYSVHNFIIFFIMIELIFCNKFTKYEKKDELGIRHEKREIGQLTQRHYSSDRIFCILECERNPACELVTYDCESGCTLFNEEITLVHTIELTNTTIFSKISMEMCKKDFYYVENVHECYAKKLGGEVCTKSVECREDKNLTCTEMNVCECLLPTIRLDERNITLMIIINIKILLNFKILVICQ